MSAMPKPTPPKKRAPADWPGLLVSFREKMGTGDKPMTQTAAAELLGVSASTWIAWENSQRVPSGPSAALLHARFPKHF